MTKGKKSLRTFTISTRLSGLETRSAEMTFSSGSFERIGAVFSNDILTGVTRDKFFSLYGVWKFCLKVWICNVIPACLPWTTYLILSFRKDVSLTLGRWSVLVGLKNIGGMHQDILSRNGAQRRLTPASREPSHSACVGRHPPAKWPTSAQQHTEPSSCLLRWKQRQKWGQKSASGKPHCIST